MDDNTLRANFQAMSSATDLYKAKDYVKAYEAAKATITNGEVPEPFRLSCAWIIYRYFKQMAGNISNENIEICSNFFISHLTAQPSLVRSLFLVQMIELSKNSSEFDFIAFCIKYDINNLRPEDFIGNEIKAGTQIIHYESLAEKLATRIYNVMKASKSPKYASLLMPFFEVVKKKCPENRFMDMYLGLLHYWKGETEAAKNTFIKILLTNPQWYIWKNMVYVAQSTEEKIAYCCKAATMINDEKYKGNLHLQLAELLADCDPTHAAMEISMFFETYKKNNWRICGDAYILQNKLNGVMVATDETAFYSKYAEKAESFVYGSLKPVEMTYTRDFIIRGKRKANLCSLHPKISISISASRLGKGARTGDVFMVRYNMVDNKPMLLTLEFVRHSSAISKDTNNDNRTEINGKVTLPRNGDFAFIDYKYYIPARIRSQYTLNEGQEIRAVACRTENGKWRIIKILE